MAEYRPPANGPDVGHYEENRHRFPVEELVKYAGQCIAWTPDGTRILASGDDEDIVEANLKALGIEANQVVWDYIPPLTSFS